MELLEHLEPQKVEEVFRLMELSSVDEIELLIRALARNEWDIESALHSLIEPHYEDERMMMESPCQMVERSYQEEHSNSKEIEVQNAEYFKLAEMQSIKEKEENECNQIKDEMEKQFARDKAHFSTYYITYPIYIKFRLPLKVVTKAFDFEDTIETLYKYVNGHLRDGFEDKHARFDLLQFPTMSLQRRMEEKLSSAFGVDDAGVVIIAKEI